LIWYRIGRNLDVAALIDAGLSSAGVIASS
jgi:hypothetical protein